MAKVVTLPYLKVIGVHKLDKLVISHTDLDHRGGLDTLANHLLVDELVVDDPSFYQKGMNCHHYPDWEYEGVHFEFFSLPNSLKGKNNHSCILKVSNHKGSILLTGDIEAKAEQYLAKTYGEKLSSNILLVPHHGSKTSSSSTFVRRVNPQFALVSYGFDNRYHFPHAQTLGTYQSLNIPVLNTVDCGMIRVLVDQKGSIEPSCYAKP